MLRIYDATVPELWIDYNQHMTEGYYGVAFGDASDALLEHAGFGEAYREHERGSFYTVETHVQFLDEVKLGDRLTFETMVLGVSLKSLHAFHVMKKDSGSIASTQETLLLHVNLDTVKVTPMADSLFNKFSELAEAHGTLPRPDGIGRSIEH
jgi:carnitine 3-dehydrogenase